MSYVRIIEESEAEGRLADLYARGGNQDGSVDNVLRVHSLNPDSLHAHLEVYISAMHRPSPLSRAEREMVAVTVSRLNGCAYCLRHHGEGLRRLLKGARAGLVEALSAGDESVLNDRERAMCAYAAKLTTDPSSIGASDIEALRGAGLDDRSVVDLACVVAYFAYANRVVLGLGASLEPEKKLGNVPPESQES